METVIQSTIAMMAVINPFVCGTMLLQMEQGDTKSNIIAGLKAMATVLIILLVSAVGGRYILSAFGISIDAFKAVGGIILAFIGFKMLGIPLSGNNKESKPRGLSGLIMFAASPGTITMVITLAAVHGDKGLPVSAIAGVTLAVVGTAIIISLMQIFSGKKKGGGQGIMTKFMGLIILAMGLQFLLDGLKDFFSL
jgi:multiple antibiotic resistance protein